MKNTTLKTVSYISALFLSLASSQAALGEDKTPTNKIVCAEQDAEECVREVVEKLLSTDGGVLITSQQDEDSQKVIVVESIAKQNLKTVQAAVTQSSRIQIIEAIKQTMEIDVFGHPHKLPEGSPRVINPIHSTMK